VAIKNFLLTSKMA